MAAKYPDNPEWQKQVTALEFIVNNQAHTATGQRTPPPPLPDDFSPVEVQNAEGYEQLDLMPVELPTSQTTLNKYFSGPVHQGLNVSKKRYYGCHLLQKRQESARLWIEQPDAVAEHYGVSKRIIAMAGHAMLDQWVMLPTMNMHNMDGSEQPPYVMGPFWPYNQTEQEVWKAMFVKYHFVGVSVMAGQLHGGVVVYNGVSIPRTYVHTITNHPQWIAYAMNAYFETAQYKSRAFSVALNLAHQIDVGSAQPVKGYEKRLPGQWGDEPTATKDIPAFVAGAEF
jgi:hypothetical protein